MLPDFQYARLYYPDVLNGLLQLKRQSWPEHTEEDPNDPVVQLYRLFSVIGHQAAVRLDHVARESFWTTLRLRSSAIGWAALLDRPLLPAATATADLLVDLTAGLTGSAELVSAHSLFDTADEAPILFEYVSDDPLESSETGTWLLVGDDGGGLTDWTDAISIQPWGATPAAQDAFYMGHPDLMFDQVAFDLTIAGSGLSIVRYEYFDDLRLSTPDGVTDLGATIRLDVTDLVGSTRADGLEVTVRSLITGQIETAAVVWVGGANTITTTSALGQVAISTSPGDYEVQTDWPELPDLVDGSTRFTVDGTVSFTLPQDDNRRWAKSTILELEGFFIRARVITVSTPTGPTFDPLTEPSSTTWTAIFEVTQGRPVSDALGTTDDGSAGQTFDLAREPFLELVELTVDDETWSRVDNFLSSTAYDRHFTLLEQADGTWRVTFGDGSAGKIPGSTLAVVADYRIGGEESGNVGAGSIVRDRSGNTRVRNVRNPRAASGWAVQEGSTPESLEQIRVEVPASLRTLERAVTPDDFARLAVAYRSTDGSQLCARAAAIEEGAGPKTVLLYVVGPGGRVPIAAELEELETYFNGELVGLQRIGGVAVANTTVEARAYIPVTTDVTETVELLEAYEEGAEDSITLAIEALLSPLAKRQVLNADGIWETSTEYLWPWGGKVSRTLIQTATTTSVNGVVNITITTPGADDTLAAGELPVPGAISVTVDPV